MLGADNNTQRGPRSPEAVKPVSIAPPPPPTDAISWPTPESAQEEEKKKAQDRGDRLEKSEKEKVSGPKSHGKEKWVTVPYVPSAVFATPLPPARRGGRPPRGGRETGARGGHMAHGSIGGEKPFVGNSTSTAVPGVSGGERGRGDMGPPRGGSFAARPRRAASAGPPTSREQRTSTDVAGQGGGNERSTTEQKPAHDDRPDHTENRRTSTATQTENSHTGHQVSPSQVRGVNQLSRKPTQNGHGQEDRPHKPLFDHANTRSNGPERRSEGSMRPSDFFRESNGFSHHRERGEGRPERGRGTFRGNRGGVNGFSSNDAANGQNFSIGHAGHQSTSGFPPSKSHSYTDRHPTSQPLVAPFNSPQRESRTYRANSRTQSSHSVANPPAYGRYPNALSSASQHLPALQTHLANMYGYETGHPGIMSAIPYNPYVEQMQLLGMVQMQM